MKSLLVDRKEDKRNSSIELLRIISMVMIIFHHFAIHGGFEYDSKMITVSRLWYNFIVMGGKVGVDVFVLISGYFLITDESLFNFKKTVKIWGQIFFYSITILIAFMIFGDIPIGIRTILKNILPVIFGAWWFASAYFAMYLIHPFLNILLRKLDKQNYQKLIVLLVVCWSIIPTFTTSLFESNALIWFICLYSIAGYIRLYGLNPRFKSRHYFGMWVVFSILTYLSSLVLSILGISREKFADNNMYFYGQEKLPILLISLSLFMGFITMKASYHRWVNIIASTTFGVYLLHDHSLTSYFLWVELFKNAQYQNVNTIIPYSVMAVFLVFAAGVVIDLVRQAVFEKLFLMFINCYMSHLPNSLYRLGEKIKLLVFG